MNTITFNLADQDRETLSKILAALERMTNCQQCARMAGAYAQSITEQREAVQADHPVSDPFPAEVPKQEKPIKREDIQRKVVELSAAGRKGTVKNIITAYADCISDIPEDKLAEVYRKLIDLV